jgi:hypothetical protein
MGCSGIRTVDVDPEIAKLLASLDTRIEEYNKTFVTEVDKIKKKKEEFLQKRHEKLSDLKKKNEEIKDETLKELNKEELKVEIDILSNQLDQMHYIFDLGLDLVDPIRKISINKLLDKAKSKSGIALKLINDQIEKMKSMPIIEFLGSTYGKVLKDALVKKGMSETVLKGFKKELMKERAERRKKEREEFGIKKNEFDGENNDKLKLDLYSLIEQEYKDINKHYRDYCRDKMVEAMFGN